MRSKLLSPLPRTPLVTMRDSSERTPARAGAARRVRQAPPPQAAGGRALQRTRRVVGVGQRPRLALDKERLRQGGVGQA